MAARVLLIVVVLTVPTVTARGCSAVDPDPPYASWPPVAPAERSTCEHLVRADLGRVSRDPEALARGAEHIRQAAALAPAEVAPSLEIVADLWTEPGDTLRPIVGVRGAPGKVRDWAFTHCAGTR